MRENIFTEVRVNRSKGDGAIDLEAIAVGYDRERGVSGLSPALVGINARGFISGRIQGAVPEPSGSVLVLLGSSLVILMRRRF
jgi:hypothetical protein